MSEDGSDGVAMVSTQHPVAPWWRRLWLFFWHRDVRAEALETVIIEVPE